MIAGALAGGETPVQVQLNSATYDDEQTQPTDATATVVFDSDGTVKDGVATAQTWLLIGAASDYDVFVHNDGPDTLLSGTLDTWLNLGTDRSFSVQYTGNNGSKTAVLQVQIRDAVSLAVLDTATITLQAIVNF